MRGFEVVFMRYGGPAPGFVVELGRDDFQQAMLQRPVGSPGDFDPTETRIQFPRGELVEVPKPIAEQLAKNFPGRLEIVLEADSLRPGSKP